MILKRSSGRSGRWSGISRWVASDSFLKSIPLFAMVLATAILQETASFQSNAPAGTGLEWLTVGSVLLPAVLLVVLVYWGAQETV